MLELGLATNQMNILLSPLQCLSLVEQSCVEIPVAADLLTRQEAKCANPIVYLDKHHVITRLHDHLGTIEVLVGVSRVACRMSGPSTTLHSVVCSYLLPG